jgi:lysophospholipase L1-like esterase
MGDMPRPRSPRLTGLLLLVALIVAGAAAARAAPGPELVGPRAIYLALGDSLAFGYQPNLDLTHGYADLLFPRLQPFGTRQMVNLACPGETTATMLAGGCRVPFLRKTRYSGSQLEQAQAVIRANRGRVSPVTLTIGANDVLTDLGPRCEEHSETFAAHLDQMEANLEQIVRTLVEALDGEGDLFVTTYYNPFAQLCPNTDRHLHELNDRIAAVARRHGAHVVTVADAFAERICELTWMCSRYRDIHATTAGYQVIAERILAAAGLPAPAELSQRRVGVGR